jgi:sulfofructosephosphate aldolase
MSTSEPLAASAKGLDRLATETGTFAMVAMDQRESLRAMLGDAGVPDGPEDVLAFKRAVVETLSPWATAILLDRDALEGLPARARAPECGLILAADALTQELGAPVTDTAIEEEVTRELADAHGAEALKLLVIWRPDDRREERIEMVGRFVDRCREWELASVVEGVVRPDPARVDEFDREGELLACAEALGGLGPDLYKAEVPLGGRGDPAGIEARCRELNVAARVPWVVLSQGVAIEDFPAAVEAACRAGASGFLAGRALWSDSVGASDVPASLRERAVPRLQGLRRTVESIGRPWLEAGG